MLHPSLRNKQMQLIIAASLLLLLPVATAEAFSSASVIPAFPVHRNSSEFASCHLDLSSEMFGGVEEACGSGASLDRSRCCPVLAAWLFAAHARSALQLRPSSPPSPTLNAANDLLPMMPETESQRCAGVLQSSLAARDISLSIPNATCDAVLCFCGIRLHELGSLICPASFNVSGDGNVKPTAGVRSLERACRNSSYAGCTVCLNSLEKLKGGDGSGGGGERVEKMMDRNCRLMGLTWLLARNKSEYIPTVSAVLRAILYSAHPPTPPYRCSPDQENMPLAVDSLQFQRAVGAGTSGYPSRFATGLVFYSVLSLGAAVLHVPR